MEWYSSKIHHIFAHGGNVESIISSYSRDGSLDIVTAKDMIVNIRHAVWDLKLHTSGIDPDLVGVHSLRAGCAMTLKLTNKSDTTIMKMGRWSGLTFLQYIHAQIAHLSKDQSRNMDKSLPFLNIASI